MKVTLVDGYCGNKDYELNSWDDEEAAKLKERYGFFIPKYTGDFDTDFRELAKRYNGAGFSRQYIIND